MGGGCLPLDFYSEGFYNKRRDIENRSGGTCKLFGARPPDERGHGIFSVLGLGQILDVPVIADHDDKGFGEIEFSQKGNHEIVQKLDDLFRLFPVHRVPGAVGLEV